MAVPVYVVSSQKDNVGVKCGGLCDNVIEEFCTHTAHVMICPVEVEVAQEGYPKSRKIIRQVADVNIDRFDRHSFGFPDDEPCDERDCVQDSGLYAGKYAWPTCAWVAFD